MIVGRGSKDRFLNEKGLTELCREALRKKDFHSKKVLDSMQAKFCIDYRVEKSLTLMSCD